MREFLKDIFTNVDVNMIVTRIIFVAVFTCVFFLFFYYAKKRNLQLYTYIVIVAMAVLFALSFLIEPSELGFYVYFALTILTVLGLMLFISDINRHIFRLSLKRKSFRENLADHYGSEDLRKSVSEIVKSCLRLSKTDTGALIVLADHMSDEILDSGIKINSEITAELIETLFFPKTPLHDGAVIIKDARVHSAGCFLPLPKRETTVSRNYGSRHRAAIGMSEQSDAIVIVVSEETGAISIARNGLIQSGLSRDELESYLRKEILPEDGRGGGIIGRIKSWRKESRNGGSDKRESDDKQAAD